MVGAKSATVSRIFLVKSFPRRSPVCFVTEPFEAR